MNERDLLDKLQKIERLFAGATTAGEKEAAADAIARIQKRLREVERVEPPIEYRFFLTDAWSKKLFIALLHRYGIRPYRYARQRRNTVMARVPRRFVDETLWPEFLELSAVLKSYLDEVTVRIIETGIHRGATDVEVVPGDFLQ